jgi:hypothetical protein
VCTGTLVNYEQTVNDQVTGPACDRRSALAISIMVHTYATLVQNRVRFAETAHLLAPSPSTIRNTGFGGDAPESGNNCRPTNRPVFRFARVNNSSNRPF